MWRTGSRPRGASRGHVQDGGSDGLAAAEAANPWKSLPTAMKQVFWRIAGLYVIIDDKEYDEMPDPFDRLRHWPTDFPPERLLNVP